MTLGFAASSLSIVWSAIPALFAAYFLFMFRQDRDKRKLTAGVSLAFMALSLAIEIFQLPASSYVMNNFYYLGDLPFICTTLIILCCQILQLRNFEKPFKVYLASLSTVILFVLLPIQAQLFSSSVIEILGASILTMSIYLFIKNRKLVDTLFLLAILAYMGYGYSFGTSIGVAFSLTCYAATFLFIGLALGFAPVENPWSNSSVFKITKQLDETKERLKELEFEYKAIFESVNDAVFVIDSKTNLILDCNVEATHLLEAEKEYIIGKKEQILFPDETNGSLTSIYMEQTVGSKPVELQVITQKDEVKDVAAKLGVVQHDDKRLLVGVFRDITEQKRNSQALSLALESLSNQKDQVQTLNEKLKVVGGLTRHDAKNKLTVINNTAYLLKKRLRNQPELLPFLEAIETEIVQCDKLFEFSRLYEKIGVEAPAEVNVGACFDQAACLIATPQIKIVNQCQDLTVTADTMLSQLFYNLIDNSKKHGEKLTQIKLYYENQPQKTLLVYEDNGVGIPQADKEKIFSEGFTTGGSGLGLKLVKKMIEFYGWTIEEVGTPCLGAKFKITIPGNGDSEEKVNIYSNVDNLAQMNPLNLSVP